MNSSDRTGRCRWRRGATRALTTLALAAIASASFAATASAQYAMTWYTVDGGGGAASGGVFLLNGTIGQPDPGILTGPGVSLGGGYWLGGYVTVGVSESDPIAFVCGLPTPNPLVQRTVLSFELPVASDVALDVYDVAGRIVQSLAHGRLPAGRHERAWNGTDARGARAAPGVYFVRFAAGPYEAHRRILVLR